MAGCSWFSCRVFSTSSRGVSYGSCSEYEARALQVLAYFRGHYRCHFHRPCPMFVLFAFILMPLLESWVKPFSLALTLRAHVEGLSPFPSQTNLTHSRAKTSLGLANADDIPRLGFKTISNRASTPMCVFFVPSLPGEPVSVVVYTPSRVHFGLSAGLILL